MSRRHVRIPSDFPVKVVLPDDARQMRARGQGDIVTDGYCGLSWDDGIVTGWTPAPSARCPFEPFHVYPKSYR